MLKLLTLKPLQDKKLFRPKRPQILRLSSPDSLLIWKLPSLEEMLTLPLFSTRQDMNSRLSLMPDLPLGKPFTTRKPSTLNGKRTLTTDFLS